MKKHLSNIEGIEEKIIHICKGNYSCGRVWTAWQYGTMTQEDFAPLEESEEFISEVMDLLKSEIDTAKQQGREEVKKQIDKTIDQLNWHEYWHEYGNDDMNTAKQQTIDMFKFILLANLDKLHSQTKEI